VPNTIPQRHPFQQFHHDEVLPILLADFMNGANVGMVERGRSASLPLKTLERCRISTKLRRKELQRHAAAEGRILGLEDDTHPAAAQLLQNAVVGNSLADHRLTDRNLADRSLADQGSAPSLQVFVVLGCGGGQVKVSAIVQRQTSEHENHSRLRTALLS
jgi:hypothetical protein